LSDTVYFLSDTHFKYHMKDPHESKKRILFGEFLESIAGAERLYLVGDIFDFWFEYRSVIPRYYGDVLAYIAHLASSGTRILITGGNHDHWFGSFLTDTFGIEILGGDAVHQIQGRRVLITHGDTLMPGDLGYKFLKAVIRNRFVVAAARLVHPDLLYSIAASVSSTSKGFTHGRTLEYADRLTGIAADNFFKSGNDAFVMGHVHLPRIKDFDGKTFIILGDWESHFTYARLEGGRFTLERYQREGETLSENL
jgi:UDP-2,3-diacylglucosamine hydrolase